MSALAGCLPRTVLAPDGILSWDLIEPVIRPKNYLFSQTGADFAREYAQYGGRVGVPAGECGRNLRASAHALDCRCISTARGFSMRRWLGEKRRGD